LNWSTAIDMIMLYVCLSVRPSVVSDAVHCD